MTKVVNDCVVVVIADVAYKEVEYYHEMTGQIVIILCNPLGPGFGEYTPLNKGPQIKYPEKMMMI